jgi:hypothetical protein
MAPRPHTPGFDPVQAFPASIWPCGHPKTVSNTRDGDWPRCAMCRREIERKASKRYRERKRAA